MENSEEAEKSPSPEAPDPQRPVPFQPDLRIRVDSAKDDIPDSIRIYTARELRFSTSRVLDEIGAAARPAIISRSGRFVAVITPLAEITVKVFSHGPLASGLIERASRDQGPSYSPEDIAARFRTH